jgi:uncharacterized protein with FMN-binding domain
MNNGTNRNTGKLIAWVVVIAAVAVIYFVFNARTNSSTANTSDAAIESSNETHAPGMAHGNPHAHGASAVFEDGTYTASSSYTTPGGSETVDVTLVIKDNIVTDSSVQQTPNDPEAAQYQAEFRQNYKPLVIGKRISDINLSRVSGSSLTSRGFNDAVEQIKNQAHHHHDS